jgi:hypothetical protein
MLLLHPQGAPVEFVNIDDNNRQWIVDFRSKALSNPHKLEEMDGSKFIAIVIPNAPGAAFDLNTSKELASILNSFVREKSKLFTIVDNVNCHLMLQCLIINRIMLH